MLDPHSRPTLPRPHLLHGSSLADLLFPFPLQLTYTLNHFAIFFGFDHGTQELLTGASDENVDVFNASDTLDTRPVLEPQDVFFAEMPCESSFYEVFNNYSCLRSKVTGGH